MQPHKAVPLFEGKLAIVAIAKLVLSRLRNCDTHPNLLYMLSRDLAFFSIVFYARNRSSDLGRAKSREVLFLPDFSGLFFNHTFGKTLRDGSTHSFCVLASHRFTVCPASNFKLYLDICRLMKVDISSGFLFRSLERRGAISEEPFIGSTPYNRLKGYLTNLGIDKGETPHSLRSGCFITLELLGIPKRDIARQVGWRTPFMVGHYNYLHQTMLDKSSASVLAAGKLPGEKKTFEECVAAYMLLNDLSGFHQVFG